MSRALHWVSSAESVTEGHPDKLADQIADAVVDDVLGHDPQGRVACKVLVTGQTIVVAGEISSEWIPDYVEIAKAVFRRAGYSAELGLDPNACEVIVRVQRQALECAEAVEQGAAGDQSIVVGYATDETDEFLPAPIAIAHRITRTLSAQRKSGNLSWLRPDGKALVTVEYVGDRPIRVKDVVLAPQHSPEVSVDLVREQLEKLVVLPSVPGALLDSALNVFVNERGPFTIGGPVADTGLTGRKIISDAYGPTVAHGGGAFSGKDPSKVDRSGAYGARFVAKNIVAAGLARRCLVTLVYAKGKLQPIDLDICKFLQF